MTIDFDKVREDLERRHDDGEEIPVPVRYRLVAIDPETGTYQGDAPGTHEVREGYVSGITALRLVNNYGKPPRVVDTYSDEAPDPLALGIVTVHNPGDVVKVLMARDVVEYRATRERRR